MKKRVIAVFLAAAMALSLTACSEGESSSSSSSTAANRTANPKVASMKMDIDADELVQLCDFDGIAVTLDDSYSLTDEQTAEMIIEDLTYYGMGYILVTDRSVIEEGDTVLLDYVGYLDGEAFDGGSAQQQMVSITEDSGYIDGFVDGLIGAVIGEDTAYEVTFPDDYSNQDLEGQTVTFAFTTYEIYQPAETLDQLFEVVTDEQIDEEFGDYDLHTLQEFIDYEQEYIDEYLEYLRTEAVKEEVEDYLMANCTVTIPDDYLDARLTEYIILYEIAYLQEDEDLETYLEENYYVSLDEAKETWTDSLIEEISYELIYTKIAHEVGIEFDEDEYAEFADNIVTTYGYEDLDEVYDYYGAGYPEDGETYLRMMYYMNLGADYAVEHAVVTIDEAAEEEDASETEEEEEE